MNSEIIFLHTFCATICCYERNWNIILRPYFGIGIWRGCFSNPFYTISNFSIKFLKKRTSEGWRNALSIKRREKNQSPCFGWKKNLIKWSSSLSNVKFITGKGRKAFLKVHKMCVNFMCLRALSRVTKMLRATHMFKFNFFVT